ncbi:MAG TPA: hypothetical protein VFV87_02860 [Pirellulaceae bacterium]|nr:hypothetical protein [Pirellulaceae bacterium]
MSRFWLSHAIGRSNAPWVQPFIREVWQFRTARRREVVLHYAPELEREFIPETLLLLSKEELTSLARKFGFRLPRVNVFLFSSIGCVTEIFGPEYAGLALPAFNAIVVGEHDTVSEHVRHELVHLFASRWNLFAPPLLTEGLAVHLQQVWCGYPIATLFRRFGSRSEWTLRSLLDRNFFFDRTYRHACYMIAGSFTSFLIDEFGWDAYRRLYRWSRPHLVEWAFRRSLGVSFDEAESRWRGRL